jgi:hypothetical protein
MQTPMTHHFIGVPNGSPYIRKPATCAYGESIYKNAHITIVLPKIGSKPAMHIPNSGKQSRQNSLKSHMSPKYVPPCSK